MDTPDPRRAAQLALASVALFGAGFVFASAHALRSPWMLAVAAGCSSLALACAALALGLLEATPLRRSLGLERVPLRPGGLLLHAVGLVGWSVLAMAAITALGLREHSALARIEAPLQQAHGPGLAALLLALGLGPGIAEELLFRGVLLRGLARRFGVDAAAILCTVAFALFHLDLAHSLGALVLGAYLVGVRVTHGTTAASILCHVFNNLVAVWLGARGAPPAAVMVPIAALAAAAGALQIARGWRAGAQRLRDTLHDGAGAAPGPPGGMATPSGGG